MNNSNQLFDIQDKRISQRLTEARESLGLNKSAFAKKAGIYPSQISELESGSRNITAEVLLKIELAHNISWRHIARAEGEVFLNNNRVAEPQGIYSNNTEELKKELELWKNKFLEVNDKYTALLESTSNHNKSATG